MADVDRDPEQRLGRLQSQLLDLDAASSRGQEQRAPGRRIGQYGGVQLALHDNSLLDQQALDRTAADRHAEDRQRGRVRLLGRGHRPDAARPAAPAGGDLRLDDRWAEPRHGGRCCRRIGHRRAGRHSDPGRGQQRLGGMLLEVHRP